MSSLNPDTSDPRKLAEALRRALHSDTRLDSPIACASPLPRCPVAAALLAVLDEPIAPHYMADATCCTLIRAAARAWLAHGGTLPGKAG